MLITNGKVIVAMDMKKSMFLEVIAHLTVNARRLLGNKSINFPFKELPYPHCENEADLMFAELKESCGDATDIQFRAIGDESVQMPGSRVKTVKHLITIDEKQIIADDLCIHQEEKETVEEEKKNVAKGYKDRLDKVESDMSSLARKHRMGYEEQDIDCFVILDYADSTKSYVQKDTSEVLLTEDMVATDYQLRIDDVRGFIPENEEDETEEDQGSSTDNGEDNLDQETNPL